MMKIAYIGQKGIPATFGGVEYHVEWLSRGLARRQVDVEVYVRKWYTDRRLSRYKGVRLIPVPTIKTKHLDASVHSLLCSLHAMVSKARIVHYHGIGPSFFSFLPRFMGKKIIITVHRLDWAAEKWGKAAAALLKFGESVGVKCSHQIIVVSNGLKEYIDKEYGRAAIHIPNGFNFPRMIPSRMIQDQYGLEEKKYILFLGRLVPEKRIDWLINAFQKVREISSRSQGIKLVIAGGSSATDKYVRYLRGLSRNIPDIIFTGYVRGGKKEELLSGAYLLVLPSSLEGHPLVLLEAKSYSVCCLASNISPNSEAIHDGKDGILFQRDSLDDLTQKLRDLIDSPIKVLKIGQEAREDIRKKMSWREVADRVFQVYQGLLSGPKNQERI